MVPLMLLVRVDVEVVFFGGGVFVPLFLAVALLPTVRAVVHAVLDLSGQVDSLCDGHHRLSTNRLVLLGTPGDLGFLTSYVQIFQFLNW